MEENKRILFFDDESYMSMALVKSLDYDWDITFVDEINELFKELSDHKFDILILDVMAPVPEVQNEFVNFTNAEINEMDEGINTGVVIAKKIWEKKLDLPILFLSARRLDTIQQLPKNRKFDYIRKPVLVEDLDIKLKELLQDCYKNNNYE